MTLGIGRAHSEVNDARVILPYSGYVGPGSLAGNASAAGAFGPTKSPRPQSFASRDMEYNAGGGVRWYLTDIFGLRADGRFTYSQVGEDLMKGRAKNVEATVGALWSFGGGPAPDTDRDGVIDRKDKCPDTPLGATVDERGCPMDTDGDGVLDGIDQCPDTPKGWPVDAKGCPLDSDGDGVADGADKCPNTPKGAKVDATGCPMDSDGDGVWDGIDKCPDTPKGARVDATGCPLDSDGDGVWDGLDKCPDTPRGTRVDANGCPVVVKSVEPMKDLVLIGVNFDSDKADITPDSAATLDTVVKSLKDWMDVTIVIEGHTDSTNTDAHNQRLSDARADSVRAYLVTAGVNAARITTKGYGEKQPIADNGTVEGRAQNRRVEIHRTN